MLHAGPSHELGAAVARTGALGGQDACAGQAAD